MSVQVGSEKKKYIQTALVNHYPPEIARNDSGNYGGNIIPEVIIGCDTDSISCVSESQPLLEPPSAIDILVMSGANAQVQLSKHWKNVRGVLGGAVTGPFLRGSGLLIGTGVEATWLNNKLMLVQYILSSVYSILILCCIIYSFNLLQLKVET